MAPEGMEGAHGARFNSPGDEQLGAGIHPVGTVTWEGLGSSAVTTTGMGSSTTITVPDCPPFDGLWAVSLSADGSEPPTDWPSPSRSAAGSGWGGGAPSRAGSVMILAWASTSSLM